MNTKDPISRMGGLLIASALFVSAAYGQNECDDFVCPPPSFNCGGSNTNCPPSLPGGLCNGPNEQGPFCESSDDCTDVLIGAWFPGEAILTLPKWEPPCDDATLKYARVQLFGRTRGLICVQNLDDNPCTSQYDYFVDVTAVAPPASPLNNFFYSLPGSTPPEMLDPDESTTAPLDTGVVPSVPQEFTNPADLNFFVASGGNTSFSLNTTGMGMETQVGDCLVLSFDIRTCSELRAVVTYAWCCEEIVNGGECVCEEPSPHYRRPGSLLLYPEFDNREGDVTILTVTNTDCSIDSGDICIEYQYIDKDDCGAFDRTECLTPCDTLTLITNFHNPNQDQGYVYVFAKDAQGNPVSHNYLIGNLLIISGLEAFDYSVNPVSFESPRDQGQFTDLDDDGIRDLDGFEYDPVPDLITVPRFLGQDLEPGPGLFQSQLIFIALSGGAEFFETVVDCLLYNDNEEDFSFQYDFYCWDKPYLNEITFAFSNAFLKTTDHDPDEIVGATGREAGWICCDGLVANSLQESISDPAFYMVLVERVGNYGVADLPFECGINLVPNGQGGFHVNGALLPRDLFGDGDPFPMDGDNQ